MTCASLWNQAIKLHNENRFLEAADCYCNCVLAPENSPRIKANALINAGIILQGLGHMAKAAACFVYAMQMNPRSSEAHSNFGTARLYLGDYHGAGQYFLKAIAQNPKCADARQNSAIISLITGDLMRGFREYEWRWKCAQFSTRPFETTKPRWKGQNLAGKTIMLTHEQGFGDSIMFIRYARMVKARGAAKVRFLGPGQLQKLFANVEGIDEYVVTNTDEDFDFHCPLLSLPNVFKTKLGNVPCDIPYVTPPYWQPVIREPSIIRIGIAWAGRPEHGKDKWRSITAKHFEPLMDIEGVRWSSLQVGPKAGMVTDLPKVYDLSDGLLDFTDTAAALVNLDLVISVDTALIHLAGAMAKPVWMLTPYNPDWRWMLERTDSPWYPTLRLFRQPALDDWDSVFSEVKRALINEVAVGGVNLDLQASLR